MALPQDHTSAPITHAAAQGGQASLDGVFPRTGAAGVSKIHEALGHHLFSLQTVQNGVVGTATVLLEGSNDKATWKTLGTNAHAGNDAKFLEVIDKPYRFVRVNKSVAAGAGDTVDYFLRMTGMAAN